jgi:hypothetical protein
MVETVGPWLDEPVPDVAVNAARKWAAERRQASQRIRKASAGPIRRV